MNTTVTTPQMRLLRLQTILLAAILILLLVFGGFLIKQFSNLRSTVTQLENSLVRKIHHFNVKKQKY